MKIYTYVTLIILVLGFLIQTRLYKSRFLLHPSFWFLVIWIVSIIAFIIFNLLGLDYIIFYEDLIIELFKYISFTTLSILFFSLVSFKRVNHASIDWNPVFNVRLFKNVSLVILVLSVITFFTSSGFNIIANREQIILTNQSLALRGASLSFMQILSNLVIGLNKPMLILSGYFICMDYAQNHYKIYKLKIYYFFPLITGLINTYAIGGRAGITTTLLFIVLGMGLALFGLNINATKIIKKFAQYGIIVFVLFSFYATAVDLAREKAWSYTGTSAHLVNKPWLRPFAGILEYMTDHYVGYQLRRVDSITPQLELGQISLSGFTLFSMPIFSQLAGTPISIQSTFNLYVPNPTKAHYDRVAEGYLWEGATATVFYLLYDDFGYKGTYIAIFIFALISQLIFNNLFNSHKTSFLSILPITLVYYLWFSTIFSHHIVGNWMAPYLYSFLIIDIIGRLKRY